MIKVFHDGKLVSAYDYYKSDIFIDRYLGVYLPITAKRLSLNLSTLENYWTRKWMPEYREFKSVMDQVLR